MQMVLTLGLSGSNAALEDIFGLLDKLAMQVDRVGCYPSFGIVFAEDVFRCLTIVVVLLPEMTSAFFGQLMGGSAISTLEGLMRLLMHSR